MIKRIGILGSTGSIGSQTLEVIRNNRDNMEVVFLACRKSIIELSKQILEFTPEAVVVESENEERKLREILKSYPQFNIDNITIFWGEKGLEEVILKTQYNFLISAFMGISGLKPTYLALSRGIDVGLANKESLVAGGKFIMEVSKLYGGKIFPLDSEHSAIFQVLKGQRRNELKKIILTGSGGPFRGKELKELENVSVEEALKHPNWSMGRKITVDSSTLMNKGLEYIEAKWLFDLKKEEIQIVIHPQSIVHSAVEFSDGAVFALLGLPDMRQSINYAINDESRCYFGGKYLDLINISKLEFFNPDFINFPLLKLAMDIAYKEDSYALVMNIANEIFVEKFLNKEIKYLDIVKGVIRTVENHSPMTFNNIDEILQVDSIMRKEMK